MSRSSIVFFFVVLCIVLSIARCNSRSRSSAERVQPAGNTGSELVPAGAPSPVPSPRATATGQANKQEAADFKKAADQVQPAVVLISVFEASGKLLKTGTGFFLSDDGRVITSRSLVQAAAHAVVKTSDGKIHNVDGILADADSLDLAIIKTEMKERVPFLSAKTSGIEQGAKVAVIGSPLSKHKPPLFEGKVSARRSDQNGEWLEVSMNVPAEAIGSPVVNATGETIGAVTQGSGSQPIVVRTSAALSAVLSQAAANTSPKWFVAESPPAPGEGPLRKVPLAGEGHPGKRRLIYSPSPQYPSSARHSATPLKATGRFRLTFAPGGEVKNITIVQSTRNAALDQAAVEALRQWKSAPGQEWTANVPITFQP